MCCYRRGLRDHTRPAAPYAAPPVFELVRRLEAMRLIGFSVVFGLPGLLVGFALGLAIRRWAVLAAVVVVGGSPSDTERNDLVTARATTIPVDLGNRAGRELHRRSCGRRCHEVGERALATSPVGRRHRDGPTLEGYSRTLAHRGVLLLDELPEFSRSVLESYGGVVGET
jgi:hypothetical protein